MTKGTNQCHCNSAYDSGYSTTIPEDHSAPHCSRRFSRNSTFRAVVDCMQPDGLRASHEKKRSGLSLTSLLRQRYVQRSSRLCLSPRPRRLDSVVTVVSHLHGEGVKARRRLVPVEPLHDSAPPLGTSVAGRSASRRHPLTWRHGVGSFCCAAHRAMSHSAGATGPH